MSHEIELKLEVAPDGAETLEAAGILKGAADIVGQVSIYFDTPDHALEKLGLSLRIRTSGKQRIQTIKAHGASAAGLFARAEWERPAKGDTPILDHTTPILALLGKDASAVGPRFEVHIERRTWAIDTADARIEAVLDRGKVIAGDRQSPICEIELELKRGASAALFSVARRIDAIVPARLGVLTKAQRGYALCGQLRKSVKAEPVMFARDLTAGQAFQEIVQACVRQYRQNETLLMGTRDAEALHQARVALRRLRSAFSIFKSMTGGKTASALRGELRWLVSELGDARNLDVLLGRLRQGTLHDRIKAAREQAYDRIETALHSRRARALMLDLVEWTALEDGQRGPECEAIAKRSAHEFAARALDRCRRKVKRGGRDLEQLDDAARHEVRKDAKKLRYAAEFFASLYPGKQEKRRCKAFIAALEQLQDELGSLNDLATAPRLLEQLGVADDPGATELLGTDTKSMLLEAAVSAHDRLIETKRFWS